MKLVTVSILLLAGCTVMSQEECRTANWYEEGERDGLIYHTQPRFEHYVKACGLQETQTAEADYMSGWAAGNAELQKRAGFSPGN